MLASIEKANRLGIHVETRTNVIPSRNDDLEMLRRIAVWIRDHLGADSPWHITKFFPAYKLSHLPATPSEILWQAHDAARTAGLRNVYVYDVVTVLTKICRWRHIYHKTPHKCMLRNV